MHDRGMRLAIVEETFGYMLKLYEIISGDFFFFLRLFFIEVIILPH